MTDKEIVAVEDPQSGVVTVYCPSAEAAEAIESKRDEFDAIAPRGLEIVIGRRPDHEGIIRCEEMLFNDPLLQKLDRKQFADDYSDGGPSRKPLTPPPVRTGTREAARRLRQLERRKNKDR